jgi:hypothetical protein
MGTSIGDETRAKVKAQWQFILTELEAGALVAPLLARLGLKPEWIRAYYAGDAQARQEWADARERSGDAFADRALEIALNPCQIIPPGEKGNEKGNEPLIIPFEPAHARNAIDTLKWAARVRNPRAYSDKAQLDINVKTVDLTRIISEANARLARGRQPVTLEHEPTALLGHAAGAAIADQASKLLELL